MFITKIFKIQIFHPNQSNYQKPNNKGNVLIYRIIKNQITKVMCSSVWYSCKYDIKDNFFML